MILASMSNKHTDSSTSIQLLVSMKLHGKVDNRLHARGEGLAKNVGC